MKALGTNRNTAMEVQGREKVTEGPCPNRHRSAYHIMYSLWGGGPLGGQDSPSWFWDEEESAGLSNGVFFISWTELST